MDKKELQEKIALYYEKLPEETKVLFASMSWLETLKEIDTKYSLNDEQIKTIGTETTILLLGIINLEDYVQIIKDEVRLESNKTNELLDEIGEKILKDIAPLLYKSYEKNLEDLIKEKGIINEDINIDEEIYNIGKKYNLPIDKVGEVETATNKFLEGDTFSHEYEKNIKTILINYQSKINEIIKELNEKIIIPKMESLKNKDNSETENIPLPPYATEKEEIKESIIVEEKKIEVPNSIETPKVDIYRESGIEIIQPSEIPTITPIQKIDTEIVKKSEATTENNIIADKLSGNTVSKNTFTDYSLPKMNLKTDLLNNTPSVTTSKSHDPYHEEI